MSPAQRHAKSVGQRVIYGSPTGNSPRYPDCCASRLSVATLARHDHRTAPVVGARAVLCGTMSQCSMRLGGVFFCSFEELCKCI